MSDPAGAAIADVAVRITSQDTGVSATTKTNSTGYYRVVDLVPGKFAARFAMSGFQNLEISGIEILPGVSRRVDAEMKLGDVSQRIEVSASAAALETEASNFGTSVEDRIAQDVPMAGRDVQTMVYLLPGVTMAAGPPGSNFGFNSQYGTAPDPTHAYGSSVSVNGGQASANAWYLDGNLNLASLSQNMVVSPSPDAISDFRVVNNSFAAENGRTGGGVFSMVLKSGSNAFHGDAYEYLRNDATDARNPFTSIDRNGNLIKARQVRFNNFGGTFGGPIVKNRTFFFFSWDTSLLHLFGQKVFSVPTQLMKQGDFSEDPNVVKYGIWDPRTTTLNADGTYSRQRLPGTAYPKSMLDPAAMYYINSFPVANFNSNGNTSCPLVNGNLLCQNYLGAVGNTQDTNNLSLKADHSLSARSKLFAEWLYNPTRYRFNRVPWTGATYPMSVGWNGSLPYNVNNQLLALGHTFVFTPTLINEFRVNYSRMLLTTDPEHGLQGANNDIPGVQKLLAPINIPIQALSPVPSIRGIGWAGGGSASFGIPNWINLTQVSDAYTLTDNLSKIAGKHTFKAGFIFRLDHSADAAGYPTQLSFSGNQVNNPLTGQGGGGSLAAFELGAVDASGSSYTGDYWSPYAMWRYWAGYVQDDFRVTKDLTLSLGVRYDYFGQLSSRFGPVPNFDYQKMNPATGLPGTVIYIPANTPIAGSRPHDFAPRLNFAWSPFGNRKWVVRGGYDIFYTNASVLGGAPGQGLINADGWSNGFSWPNQNPGCGAPNTFTSRCTAWFLSDTTTNKGDLSFPKYTKNFPAMTKDPLLGTGPFPFLTPVQDPRVQNWNFGIQHELPGDVIVSATYVGSQGSHLSTNWYGGGGVGAGQNIIPTAKVQQLRSKINSVVPIQSIYSGDVGTKLAQVYVTDSLPLSTLLLPYPFFGAGFSAGDTQNGANVYHSLQARVQKRFSHGLSFLGSFTWSKNIVNGVFGDETNFLVDPIHYGARGFGTNLGGLAGATGALGEFSGGYQVNDKINQWAVGASDIAVQGNLAATYELPVGKGKPFLAGAHRVVDAILGGWRLTGNFNAQDGVPMHISGPPNNLTRWVTTVGSPNFNTSRSKLQREQQWINPAGFQPVFGNDPNVWSNYDPTADYAWVLSPSGPRSGALRSPGFWNLDTSLAKKFFITEAKYVEFRWEMFNALNHMNLGYPNTNYCLPPGPNGEVDLVHQAGCSFGRITNIQTDPRAMQFALKFFF